MVINEATAQNTTPTEQAQEEGKCDSFSLGQIHVQSAKGALAMSVSYSRLRWDPGLEDLVN
jgi:hypothetical protein